MNLQAVNVLPATVALDQRAGTILGERPFETGDGFDLAIAHASDDKRMRSGHLGKPANRQTTIKPQSEGRVSRHIVLADDKCMHVVEVAV